MPEDNEVRRLNPQQKRAVAHGNGPLLIIAGAGTGKTTVVTERIAHIIRSGKAKPDGVLALTFTEKAAREMQDRIDRILPYGVTQMWISTFHAFADRVLRAEAVHFGIDPSFRVMSQADSIRYFTKRLHTFDLSYFRPYGNPGKYVRPILTHISRLRDEDVSPAAYRSWFEKASRKKSAEPLEYEQYAELVHIYERYQEMKRKDGLMDYADLIGDTLELMRTRPHVLGKYRTQFTHILVDEFQDTNHAQNELAIMLAGRKANLTVVGDDDQSIYRFRGAAISNVLSFRKRFPKAKTVVLTRNYRSYKEILDRSYGLIRHNDPDRLEVREGIDKKLIAVRGSGGRDVVFHQADRVENEAEHVARTIRELMDAGGNVSYKDVAILVRANDHAEPFVRALSRHGIPYQFLGPGRLFRKEEVKDLIAYLRTLADPTDSIAWYRVLTMPWAQISARDLAGISGFSKKYGISLYETCEFITDRPAGRPLVSGDSPSVSPELKHRMDAILGMVERHMEASKRESAGQVLYAFLQDTGILRDVMTYDTAAAERRAVNIAAFFNKLKTYEAEHEEADVRSVVEWIDLAVELGESPLAGDTDWSANNAVNILTVHSSKGLEFPYVFLVNLVNGRFPSVNRKDPVPIPDALIRETLPEGDHHMEEERRLFYVGMTRARDGLFLTASAYYGEGKRERVISSFVKETLGDGAIGIRDAPDDRSVQMTFLEWEKTEEKEERVAVPDRLTLSYSKIEAFNTCPLKYKYRFILSVPEPPTAALVFGDTIHKTLRQFYEVALSGAKVSDAMLRELYERNWSSLGFADRARERLMKAHGAELLTKFLSTSFDSTMLPLHLEYPFRLKLTDTLTVNGRLDRVDRLSDGRYEIIDYKTGQAMKSKDAATDPQLTMYALAASDASVFGAAPESVVVSFLFLETGEKVSATRRAEDLSQMREKIIQDAARLRSSSFAPTPGRHCDFCEFRLLCSAWQ